jgi:hypothetical protein
MEGAAKHRPVEGDTYDLSPPPATDEWSAIGRRG